MRLNKSLLLMIALLTGCLAASGQRPGPIFASFEKAEEASSWQATGAARAEPSTEFPGWQTHSLRVEIPAGEQGGVETKKLPERWDRQEALQFFVYAERPATITVRVTGESGEASASIPLRTGSNHVQFRTAEFAAAGLRAVKRLALSAGAGNEPAVLYLDRFRLAPWNDVLARTGRMDAPYSIDIATPHKRWARPYAKGLVRILIVPDVAHGRAAVELAQRLDSRLFTVTLGARSGTNRWGFGDFYGERGPSYGAPFTLAHTYLADDLINGPDYDVMVLPGTRPWEEFPEVVRRAIARRVKDGMGLVLIDPQVKDRARAADLAELTALWPLGGEREAAGWHAAGDHYVTRNVPFDAFPYTQMRQRKAEAKGQVLVETSDGDPILAVREVGRGRVVTAVWRHRGLIPQIDNEWETGASWRYWEYLQAWLARCVVWAARKEPEHALGPITIDRAGSPGFARTPVPAGAEGRQLEVVFRDEFSAEQERVLEKLEGATTIETPLPAEPWGRRNFVEVILRNVAGKTIDWGIATYGNSLPVEITAIEFSQDRFPVGAGVTGQIRLSERPAAGATLRLRLYDNYDRLLDEQTVSPSANAVPFSLASEGCLTRLARVDAELSQPKRFRHRKQAEVFILRPEKWDHYDIVMYLFGAGPAPGLWNTIQQRLKQMYVTTLSSYPLSVSKHANFGVQAQTRISGQESPDGASREPYLERKREYARTKDKKYLARLYCLNDPEYLRQEEKEIATKVKPWVPFSPMSYYIYEEPSLTCYDDAMDLCFSRFCMAKMREWLKSEYGDLTALNGQWGTSFTRWEDVTPDTTEEAQARGNYSSWADHRTFMEVTYAGNYSYVRSLLHRHDPSGLVLLSGTQSSTAHNGCDYSRLDYIVDHLNPYNHEGQLEFHRSFNHKLKLSGGSGYGVHGRQVFYNFYSNLFHGYWAGSYVFWQYSILNPDYRFCQSAKDIRDGYREIVDGALARLVRDATRENNGIAIHYSYPSIHGSWIVDGRTYPPVGRGPNDLGTNAGPTGRKFGESRDGWIAALKDLGLQFDFVPRQQIEAGDFVSRGFRVLVLPFSIALTDQEVGEIRRFVKAGGAVIADGHAGVMDGHAKWLEAGSLDDVFGIRRPAPARAAEVASTKPDRALELAGATALDELDGAPILLRNSYGDGAAVYLNFFLTTYIEDSRDGKAGRSRELLAKALSEAGVSAPFRVLGPDGVPLERFELIPYHAGAARYLGLLKENDALVSSEQFAIDLGQTAAVYDLRGKRYLGRVEKIRGEIRTAEPKLYALLPAPVRSVSVSSAAGPRRGHEFSYEVDLEAPAGVESAIRVKVFRPGSKLAREYSTTLSTRSGKAGGSFPIARNDPAGEWKIEAADAISGKTATATFTLE